MSAVPRSPQIEEGHVKLANELYEAITAFDFSKTQLRVLLAVLRKTYGYGKKEDDLSASQLGSLLGKMSRQHITTALNELAAMNVIFKRPGRFGSIIGINKDYSQWLDSPKCVHLSETRTSPKPGQVSEKGASGSPKSGQVDSPKSGHTKDNLPKDNQQKESANADSSAPSAYARLSLVPTPPPVASLPLKDGSEFEVSQDQVAEWSAAYPTLDVTAELLRMRVWLRAKPQNLKTRRGIGAFIVGWLGRSLKPAPGHSAVRPTAHGNFAQQDYRAGVGEDGSF